MGLFKSESTNEKIARLHKEGVDVQKISDEVSLPVDVVENVIRRKFPEEIEKQKTPSIQFVESGVLGFSKTADSEVVTVADIAKDFAEIKANESVEENVLIEEETKSNEAAKASSDLEESDSKEDTENKDTLSETVDLRGEDIKVESDVQAANVEEKIVTAVVEEARGSALTKMQKFASSEKMKAEQVVEELSSELSSLETEEADILVKYSEINKQKLEIEARVSDVKAKISSAKQEIADWDIVLRTGTKLG